MLKCLPNFVGKPSGMLFTNILKMRPKIWRIIWKRRLTRKRSAPRFAEENSIFLIAEIENESAGYAKITLGAIEDGITAEKPIELNRLYSKQEFLGKGVGARLMDECFRIAKENDCDVMWLGVWEFNPRAQTFYRKYGFYEVGRHIFQLGSDAQTDLLMQKEI